MCLTQLEHHADFAADRLDLAEVAGKLDAVDEDLPLLMLFEPVDAADHRRLAGARGPAHHDLLAAPDGEVDILQHVKCAEPLVDMAQLDHRAAARRGFIALAHRRASSDRL
jgi:hypothetical protein